MRKRGEWHLEDDDDHCEFSFEIFTMTGQLTSGCKMTRREHMASISFPDQQH